MNTSKRDMRALAIEERRINVLRLRSQGFTWHAIGSELGISHEQARQDYLISMRELRDQRTEETDIAREKELQQIEQLRAAFYSQALAGDKDAAATVLKASAQIAQLLGLHQQVPTHDGDRVIQLSWNTTTIHYNTPAPQPATITFDSRDAEEADYADMDASADDPPLLSDGTGTDEDERDVDASA